MKVNLTILNLYNKDTGIGALDIALQSVTWRGAILKEKNQKQKKIFLEDDLQLSHPVIVKQSSIDKGLEEKDINQPKKILDISNNKENNQKQKVDNKNESLKENDKEKHSDMENINQMNVKYEKLDDELEFDVFLDKISEIRKINTSNPNISDQERRANAEKAILMLAKFMNLDDDEFDNEETDD